MCCDRVLCFSVRLLYVARTLFFCVPLFDTAYRMLIVCLQSDGARFPS